MSDQALKAPLCHDHRCSKSLSAWFEGVPFALLPQFSMMCSAFWKTLALDRIMCAHAAAASLYLSLFSLLGVDIRWQNFMANSLKGTSSSTFLQLMGQKGKGGIRFSTGWAAKNWNPPPRHLIWRLRLTLRSFVFLSLEHSRVCLAVST